MTAMPRLFLSLSADNVFLRVPLFFFFFFDPVGAFFFRLRGFFFPNQFGAGSCEPYDVPPPPSPPPPPGVLTVAACFVISVFPFLV